MLGRGEGERPLARTFEVATFESAPKYEAAPAYDSVLSAPSSNSSASACVDASGTSNGRVRRPKRLAQTAAETYFREILRRDRELVIKTVVTHYKADLALATVHNKLIDIESSMGQERVPCRIRDKRLRNWVNKAIEDVVIPELDRREAENKKIWRADQKRLRAATDHVQLDAAYRRRIGDLDAKESAIRSIFGDIGTGTKTAGIQVSELGKQGAQAAQARAKRIAELLRDRDDEMIWECKKLQTKCLERMQSSWRLLIEHCVIQISLVKERGRRARETGFGTQDTRQGIIGALMDYEAEKMEIALAELLSMFDRSVELKPTEFPPLVSFYRTFTPLNGSALRAAREVSSSQGIVYDTAFLSQNNLDAYAQDFYLTMKDHLTMLMVDIEVKKTAWKEDRRHAVRRASEPLEASSSIRRITVNGRTFSTTAHPTRLDDVTSLNSSLSTL